MNQAISRPNTTQEPIHLRSFEGWRQTLAIGLRLGDLALVAFAGILTHQVRFPGVTPNEAQFLALILGLLLATQCLALAGCYDARRVDRLTSEVPRAIVGWSAAMLCTLAALYFIQQAEPISRIWIGSWFGAALWALIGLRCLGKLWIIRARQQGALLRRIAIVREPHTQFERILDGIDMDPSLAVQADIVVDFTTAEAAESLVGHLHALDSVEQVVVVCDTRHTEALAQMVQKLRHLPVEINLVVGPLAGDLPVIGMRAVGSLPATVLLERPMDGPLSAVKDVFDRVAAFALIVFLAPLLALISLAIKLDSPGPVLYRQVRFGFNRQKIEVLKFRSMYQERCDAPAAGTVAQATRDDDRITPVGRFLRRTSLDELPQFFNVLRGDMSLVGPRPHAIAHDHHYSELIDGYLGRHRVKPGITGWAQVNGCRGETRSADDMRRRIELDLYYIDNWSLSLDLKILLRTPLVGFMNENAY
jgi:Undecaprenyl-phosphate glucose phosphotransferase